MTPADALRELRRVAGHTQAVAAACVGVKPRCWQRWEAGDRAVRTSALELYAERTGQRLLLARLLADGT